MTIANPTLEVSADDITVDKVVASVFDCETFAVWLVLFVWLDCYLAGVLESCKMWGSQYIK